MKITRVAQCAAVGVMFVTSGPLLADISGDLLTNSSVTTQWQNCDGSNLIPDTADTFDPSHLEDVGCVYRETPVMAGEQYKMTCGVVSAKYSSMTLAFLDGNGQTLDTKTTDINEDMAGGAYSVELSAPQGTVNAAVGLYGLAGSGFQDCTLLLDNPAPTPVDGSIQGTAWFDANENGLREPDESTIPATPVAIFRGTELISSGITGPKGNLYFGGLDVDACYRLEFGIPDPSLTFAAASADNDAVNDGATLDICLTADEPNVAAIDAGFVAVPPAAPPVDYAVCGQTYIESNLPGVPAPNVRVVLTNVSSGEEKTLRSRKNGRFVFANLPAGDYKLTFAGMSGFDFIAASATPERGMSFAGADGMTPQFNLPGDANGNADDACTIRHANAGMTRTPVAIDPTVAEDDHITGEIGEALTVSILDNDEPCDGSVQTVDVLGHNVPGVVVYDASAGTFVISNTTASGQYSIEYGLRGSCGSYDTAQVLVTIEEAPPTPVANAPQTPICLASIGKLDGVETGVHVDIKLPDGSNDRADYASEYRFFDANDTLVFTGLLSAAKNLGDNGIFWRKREDGVEVLNIATVIAVENGVESARADCVKQAVTPIAIDTNHDGSVDKMIGSFAFDINGDGIQETLTEWFGPEEGILVSNALIAVDGSQHISGEHLFGDTGGQFADGFAKLATLDADNDGVVAGQELLGLSIWTDRNSNARLDEGELSTLASHTISQLSVEHYRYAARATLNSGETLIMRDLWFPMQAVQQAAR